MSIFKRYVLPALRIAGYVVFALLVLFLAAGLSLNVLQANPDATVFGIRYQVVTDTDNTVIAPGSLVFIDVNADVDVEDLSEQAASDVDAEYLSEQVVSYEYTNEQSLPALGISTVKYLQEGSYNRIIGVVVGSVPVLGSILSAIAFNAVITAVIAALILVLLLTVGSKKQRYIVPALCFLIGIGFMVYGIMDGEMKMVLTKAVAICLECIGIG